MNLIEQLGGYHAAKNLLGGISNNKSPNEILNRELLEYRRQHNIFEVGDKVIYLILGNDVITYDDWLKTQNSNWIRHATDEEIAAGNRL